MEDPNLKTELSVAAAGARDPPGTAMALPTDMLQDILLRLPADEVCRTRLVCPSWRTLTFDPHFAKAHASHHPQPHVIVVRHDDDDDEGLEVRDADMHGNVIKSMRIRQPVVGRLSIHGDLLCASHGWGLTSVVDMVTGAVADMAADARKKVNSATPHCVLGHVPATGEYKVLRIQADYSCRRRRQRCDVMTLGGRGDAGRWRLRTCPPVSIRIERPWPSSWNVAVVAGLAYFLVGECPVMDADSLAVFDLATELWKPGKLQGPLTSSFLARGEDLLVLCWYHFQLARLGESLVVLHCNVKNGSTELWFLEDMVMEDDTTTTRWSRRYTLQPTVRDDDDGTMACWTWSIHSTKTTQRRTPYGDDEAPLFHYPLAILQDGRILVWVNRTSALKAYDPQTCTWTNLVMLTGDCVVGMHHGSLLCSNVGAVQP